MINILVNIDVEELGRGVKFYSEAFGLSAGRKLGPRVVELLGAQAPIFLLAKPAGTLPFPKAPAPRDYGRHWTPLHLDFVVDDLDAALARAEQAGAVREGGVDEYDWGRIAFLADPFGNGLCLLQFKGRGYDEIATG